MEAPDFFNASKHAANLARYSTAAAVAANGEAYEGLVWEELEKTAKALGYELLKRAGREAA